MTIGIGTDTIIIILGVTDTVTDGDIIHIGIRIIPRITGIQTFI